jgi:hypothetical protein
MSDGERSMLRRFLGALAYRTQKALRDAPAHFDTFEAGGQVRSPRELVRHMTAVLGYARTFFLGDYCRAEPLSSLAAEERGFTRSWNHLASCWRRRHPCTAWPKHSSFRVPSPTR